MSLFLVLLLGGCCFSSKATVIPPYTRGSQPTFLIPEKHRDNGITYLGSHERLRTAVDKVRVVCVWWCEPAHGRRQGARCLRVVV